MQTGLLELIQTFVRVVEVGSFTAVAEELNSSQPTISRQISTLEEQLKARLFLRTTRTLDLTNEGKRFYEEAINIIKATEKAQAAVSSDTDNLYGKLRIGGTAPFTRIQLLPRFKKFLEQWPDLEIEFVMSDRIVDPHEQNLDVSIRIGHVSDSSLKAVHLSNMRRITVAASEYLERFGTPKFPSDLVHHKCVAFNALPNPDIWQFWNNETGETTQVKLDSYITSDSADTAAYAVVCGLGIGLAPDWAFTEAIKSGHIKRILERFEPPTMPINIVYPNRRALPRRIELLVEYLVEDFKAKPVIETSPLLSL